MKEQTILGIKNNPIYQELNAYYSQSTVFSALGIERNENRHSAFLNWLLNPKSDHQLGVEPLKKFLALYSSVNEKLDAQIRAALITGRYDIEDFQIDTEVSLSGFCSEENEPKLDKNQKRLDIWAEFSIALPDATNNETVALVIENKIYSKEWVKDGRSQTQIYHDCLSQYYQGQNLFEVFLTPEDKTPKDKGVKTCPDFVHLTYQQLLDNVLQPVSLLATNKHAKMLVGDYIRNLGRAALNDEEQAKTYSILATSAYEREKLQQLLLVDGMKEIIEGCLYAVYGEKAKKVVGKEAWERLRDLTSYDVVLLTEFWNANVEILKAMLHTIDIFHCKKEDVDAILKENNRDNTKYFVEREENGKWVPADKNFSKPVAKGRAACVFFTRWMSMSVRDLQLTIDEVREAFPLSINQYYFNNKWDFLDTLVYEMKGGTVNSNLKREIINKAGKKIEENVDKWDFYPIEAESRACGWAYLKDRDIAVMPKMWRKDDFQRLLDHIDKHPELFKGIRIRQA